MYVVGRASPFHWTLSDATNPCPSTVSTKPAPPVVTMLGSMECNPSAGMGWIVKESGCDFRGSGAESVATKTGAVPAFKTCADETAAVSWLVSTQVVGSAVPPKYTTAPISKFVPMTVGVNPADPATVELGERPVTVGNAKTSNSS